MLSAEWVAASKETLERKEQLLPRRVVLELSEQAFQAVLARQMEAASTAKLAPQGPLLPSESLPLSGWPDVGW